MANFETAVVKPALACHDEVRSLKTERLRVKTHLVILAVNSGRRLSSAERFRYDERRNRHIPDR